MFTSSLKQVIKRTRSHPTQNVYFRQQRPRVLTQATHRINHQSERVLVQFQRVALCLHDLVRRLRRQ